MKPHHLILLTAVLALVGCGSRYLDLSTNVSNEKKQYEKILVIVRSLDQGLRVLAEQQMVDDLRSAGVDAAPSLDLISSESLGRKPDQDDLQALKNRLLANGFSGVVVTNLVDTRQYAEVLPGSSPVGYVPVRYRGFGRYYAYYPVYSREPDRVFTGVEYVLESCLYDLNADQQDNLQWIGRFKIRDPGNLGKTIERYSREMTDELLRHSLQP